jgi:TolA-binding protein
LPATTWCVDLERLALLPPLTNARSRGQSSTNARLKDLQSELKVVKKTVKDLESKIQQTSSEIEELEEKQDEYERVIAVEEDAIFRTFCRRIKVANIRQYEEKQMGDAQAANEANLKFKTQIARLKNQSVLPSPRACCRSVVGSLILLSYRQNRL